MVLVAIVGAGPAGCLTARRLADAGHEVTLFDAGERLRPTLDFASYFDRSDVRWPADPTMAPDVIRARAVGGASAINGMLLSAPDHVDLASWDSLLGLAGGSARSSLERVVGEVAPQIAVPGPFALAISDAALRLGDQVGGSTLDVDAAGVLVAALAARSGERRDGAAVYLDDAPSSLRVVEATTITSLDDAQLEGFDHVVVSAGALASPRLVAAAVPGLGIEQAQHHQAQQHRAVAISVPLAVGQRVERDQLAVTRVVRWSSGVDAADTRADIQLVVLDHLGWTPAGRSHGLIIVSLLAGSDLDAEPTSLDRARLRAGIRRALQLLAVSGFTPADQALFADTGEAANNGGGRGAALSDADLDRWVDAQSNPVHHVTSTLPLGIAVGRAGLVAGRHDLSVIDASVLPVSPRADTNMPVLVVADILATQLVDHLA